MRYKTNDYSLPSTYGFRDVTIRAFVDVVEIGYGGQIIARHTHCGEQMVFNPLHYFALLERKPGALSGRTLGRLGDARRSANPAPPDGSAAGPTGTT